jgi:hypothetical protein
MAGGRIASEQRIINNILCSFTEIPGASDFWYVFLEGIQFIKVVIAIAIALRCCFESISPQTCSPESCPIREQR